MALWRKPSAWICYNSHFLDDIISLHLFKIFSCYETLRRWVSILHPQLSPKICSVNSRGKYNLSFVVYLWFVTFFGYSQYSCQSSRLWFKLMKIQWWVVVRQFSFIHLQTELSESHHHAEICRSVFQGSLVRRVNLHEITWFDWYLFQLRSHFKWSHDHQIENDIILVSIQQFRIRMICFLRSVWQILWPKMCCRSFLTIGHSKAAQNCW